MSTQVSHLVLCSLRYSDNLGDGVIAGSLEHMLSMVRPDLQVRHVDMAGRTKFEPRPAQVIGAKKRIFYMLPAGLRSLATLAFWMLGMRAKLAVAWAQVRPPGPFFFVFAGGQMVSDVALNFPLKFRWMARRASKEAVAAAVFATGASSEFSAIGRCLFRRAFSSSRFRYVGARDALSQRNLDGLMAGPPAVRLTVDPGVWAAEAYGVVRVRNAVTKVGVGVAHPLELGAHVSSTGRTSYEWMIDLLSGLVVRLGDEGLRPVLFNNGSAEDQLFLAIVVDRLNVAGITNFEVAERPLTPLELVECISGFDAIVAHRLHASVIAYSLKIPCVGLRWDDKVKSFYDAIGRHYLCPTSLTSSRELVQLVLLALNERDAFDGVDPLKERALSSLAELLEEIEK